MFYLQLLIGLISSKKDWTVAKNLLPILIGVIQVKFHFHEILTNIETKYEKDCIF